MADRGAYLYLKDNSEYTLTAMEQDMVRYGLRLTNPASGKLTCFSQTGLHCHVSRELVEARFTNKKHIGVQWWLDGETDLPCFARSQENTRVEYYSFRGLLESETRLVADLLIARFERYAISSNAIGLMIDSQGVTSEYFWDDFFLRNISFDLNMPDRIVFRNELIGNFHVEPSQFVETQYGGFRTLIRRNTSTR